MELHGTLRMIYGFPPAHFCHYKPWVLGSNIFADKVVGHFQKFLCVLNVFDTEKSKLSIPTLNFGFLYTEFLIFTKNVQNCPTSANKMLLESFVDILYYLDAFSLCNIKHFS
jgi:hypothetical protein